MPKHFQPTTFHRNHLSVLSLTVDEPGVDLRQARVIDVSYAAHGKAAFPWASMCYSASGPTTATLVISVATHPGQVAAGSPTGTLTVTLQQGSNPPIPVPAPVDVGN